MERGDEAVATIDGVVEMVAVASPGDLGAGWRRIVDRSQPLDP